jgi:hypothetical protein
MPDRHFPQRGRRGITVLTLLLLIIAIVLLAVLLIRYLGDRPTTASSISHNPTSSAALSAESVRCDTDRAPLCHVSPLRRSRLPGVSEDLARRS